MQNGIFLNRFAIKNNWSNLLYRMLATIDIDRKNALVVPKNMRINEKPDGLHIEYSWFKIKYLLLIFVFPMCSVVVLESEYIQGSLQQLTLPVITILIINLGVIYYCLTRLLNTTNISVNKGRIQIEHKPLPLSKNISIKREDVTQLFVTKHRRGHRYYVYSSTYQLNAILTDGSVITLISGLYYPEQGSFIEKKIEQFLGITDISIDGEIDK